MCVCVCSACKTLPASSGNKQSYSTTHVSTRSIHYVPVLGTLYDFLRFQTEFQNSHSGFPDSANPSILSNEKHQTEPGPASSKSTMRPPSPQTSREMPLSRSWHLQGIRLSWNDHPVLKHVQLHPRFDYDTCIYIYMQKRVYNSYAYINIK